MTQALQLPWALPSCRSCWALRRGPGPAEATKAAQRACIEHAKQSGERKYLGRKPGFTRQQFRTVRDMLSQATGIAQIAKAAGLSRQTVYRIKGDPAACEAALTAWGI